jgi:preprotein translocase subunit SecE
VAQQNRRGARKGGSAARKPRQPRQANEGSRVPGALESGEEQLTEAQLALGRPELAETPNEQELTAFEEADAGHGGGGGNGGLVTTGGGGGGHGGGGGDAVHAGGGASVPARLVGFVKGSWRELQRVQWPDRRQVFQATGVVLGFVIVAGAFLGLASFAAQKIVNLILYGHG